MGPPETEFGLMFLVLHAFGPIELTFTLIQDRNSMLPDAN